MKQTNFLMTLIACLIGALMLSQTSDACPLQDTASAAADKKPASEVDSKTSDVEGPGIAIGKTLPVINLKKQDGTEVSVQQLAKQGPVAIVFYRSASW